MSARRGANNVTRRASESLETLSAGIELDPRTEGILRWRRRASSKTLNGDGAIGAPRVPPPAQTGVETSGSTSLSEVGSNYFLQPNGGPAVELGYGGSPVFLPAVPSRLCGAKSHKTSRIKFGLNRQGDRTEPLSRRER